MLHAKGIHDLLLPVPVAIKVPGHHVDHKDLFLVGLAAVVLLIFPVGGHFRQFGEISIVGTIAIQAPGQENLLRMPHALRRRTSQRNRRDQLTCIVHNSAQKILLDK